MMNRKRILYIVLLLLALGLRLITITRVAIEVDEPVNWEVSRFILEDGFPAVKGQLGNEPETALFHPPFGFQIAAGWFRLMGSHSLITARILSVIAAMIAIVLLVEFLRRHVSFEVAMIVLILVGTDGWLVTTNSMFYLENLLLPLVVATVWMYYRCLHRSDFSGILCIVTGILLGSVFSFKHIGFYVVLGVLAGWFALRRRHKDHATILVVSAIVVGLYGIFMFQTWGDIWWDQTYHQFQRTLGLLMSRGLNYDFLMAIKVIVDRYWIYALTIVGIVIGSLMTCWGYLTMVIRARRNLCSTDRFVLVVWGMGAILFAVGTALKSPHYFMLWLFPFLSLIAIIIGALWLERPKLVVILLIIVVGCNFATFSVRILTNHGDAIAEAAKYVETEITPDAFIGTEPYIGYLFPQSYVRYDQATKESLLRDGVDYLVVYETTTAHIPKSIGGETVWEYCHPLMEVSGFKDSATICEVDVEALRQAINSSN